MAATQVDTVVHTHLIVDSTRASGRTLHEINVIGTMSLLAAAGASGSPVRKVVLKSSGLVYGAAKTDPYFFREEMTRTSTPTTNVERSLLEVEAFLRDFADDSPHVNVTLLRFTNVLGDDLDTPFALALRRPVVPEILGFDPRVQFVHEDDVVGALMYATNNDVPGVYNVAGDGNMPWSEVCALVRKPRDPAVAVAHQPGRRAARVSCVSGTCPPRRCNFCVTVARSTTRATSRPVSGTSTRTRAPSKPSLVVSAWRRRSATSTRPTGTNARSKTSSGTRRP